MVSKLILAVLLSLGSCELSWADFHVATGIYEAPAATGSDTKTGLSFQPKFVYFWWNLRTSDGTSPDFELGIGFCDSTATNHRQALGVSVDDAADTQNVDRASSNVACIFHRTNAGVTALSADFSAFTSDGWTLNWANTTAGVDIHFWALGGSDLANTFVGLTNKSGSLSVPVAQAITGVGFQPDFIFLMLDDVVADVSGAGGSVKHSYGMATSASARAVISHQHTDASGTSDSSSAQYTSNFVHLHAGADTVLGDITAIGPDGFTVTLSVNTSTQYRYRYFCLKGPSFAVTTFNQRSDGSIGNDVTTGVSFQPEGEMYFSYNAAASGAIQTGFSRISIGATDGTNQNCTWAGEQDAAPISIADHDSDTTAVLKMMTEGTPTTQAKATFTSFGSNGRTLNWNPADTAAREVVAWSVAGAGAPSSMVPILLLLGGNDD